MIASVFFKRTRFGDMMRDETVAAFLMCCALLTASGCRNSPDAQAVAKVGGPVAAVSSTQPAPASEKSLLAVESIPDRVSQAQIQVNLLANLPLGAHCFNRKRSRFRVKT